ncbi:MAG: DUF2007 domain-containing protein [Myxococcota bacterium]
MASERDWVLLVECHSIAELQTVRATLEARGVPCQIHGEHAYGVLGPLHGAMIPPRVFVPRAGLALAREVVEDIVGPFDQPEREGEDPAPGSPYRNAEPVAANDGVEPTAQTKRKSWGILPLILFIPFLPLFGVTHLHAGRSRRAGMLFFFSLLVVMLVPLGAGRFLLLALMWVTDVLGGSILIADHNQAVRALEAARAQQEAEDEQDEDGAELVAALEPTA